MHEIYQPVLDGFRHRAGTVMLIAIAAAEVAAESRADRQSEMPRGPRARPPVKTLQAGDLVETFRDEQPLLPEEHLQRGAAVRLRSTRMRQQPIEVRGTLRRDLNQPTAYSAKQQQDPLSRQLDAREISRRLPPCLTS